MRLLELFDRTAEWTKTKTMTGPEATFEVPNPNGKGTNTYRVTFLVFALNSILQDIKQSMETEEEDEEDSDVYGNLIIDDQTFGEIKELVENNPDSTMFEVEFSLYDRGPYHTQEITGSGNEYLVFSTVLAIIKDFVQEYNIKFIQFEAKEPSRQKLYERLIRANHPKKVLTYVSHNHKNYIVEL